MPRKVPQIETHREGAIKAISDAKATGATRIRIKMPDGSGIECDFATEALDRGTGRNDFDERPPPFLKRAR